MMDTSDPYDGTVDDTAGHVVPGAPDPDPVQVTDPLESSWVAPADDVIAPPGDVACS